jgi:predicted nucleotidyltransferase
VPPVRFEDLVDAVAPDEIRTSIASLLRLKRNTPELGLGKPVPEINSFIETELERHGTRFSGQGRPDLLEGMEVREELNEIFRRAIAEGAA